MSKKQDNEKKSRRTKEKPVEDEMIQEQEASPGEKEPGSADTGKPEPEEMEAEEDEPVRMVMLPAADLDGLKAELKEAQELTEKNFDGWQRERADFLNYKKRIERDRMHTIQDITVGFAKKYLPIMDDIELALKNQHAEGTAESWREGIDLIHRKLQTILESEGVIRIAAEEEIFDPTRHEAISHEDNPNHKSGEIIEVIQQGYMLGDRVLRPALVRVAQ